MKVPQTYPDEGYIKFTLQWKKTAPFSEEELATLIHHRDLLFREGLIGFDREHQVGFGNISQRITGTNMFYISATQTGHIPRSNAEHFAKVISANSATNALSCQGPMKASSESMTHAAIYTALKGCNAVIHIHHSRIWLADELPFTDESIPYGTPEMAEAVSQLVKKMNDRQQQVLVMKGHKDGIIVFGNTLEDAARALFTETPKHSGGKPGL